MCSSPGTKSRAGTGGTTCFCNLPLVHKAVNQVAKPLMEQALAILGEISHSMWCKFTVVPVSDLLVMSLKSRAVQLFKIKVPLSNWSLTSVRLKSWAALRPPGSSRACSIPWGGRWKEGKVPSPEAGWGHSEGSKGRQMPSGGHFPNKNNTPEVSPALWPYLVVRCQSSWARGGTVRTASVLARLQQKTDFLLQQEMAGRGIW